MKEHIEAIKLALPDAQKEALDTFLTESTSVQDIEKQHKLGTKLFSVPSDAMVPEQYNSAIAAAIADLAALYKGLDTLSAYAESVDSVSSAELDRLASEIDQLEKVLDTSLSLRVSNTEYTHTIHQIFDTDTGDPGALPPYIQRLTVDMDHAALVRPLSFDTSKVLPDGKNVNCRVVVENMLGLSAETRHGAEEAIDGSTNTFWREVILAEAPIYSSHKAVSWLPSTYKAGAAVRLRFDFESVVTVSDLSIKSLAGHPMEILEVAWVSPERAEKSDGGTVSLNGIFTDLSGWTKSGTASADIVADGSHNKTSCLSLKFPQSGSMKSTSLSHNIELAPNTKYTISFYAWASTVSNKLELSVLESGASDPNGTITTPVAFTESIPFWISSRLGWTKYSHTFETGDTTTSATFVLNALSPGGEIRVDDIQISSDYFTLSPGVLTDRPSTTVSLISSNGEPVSSRTIWLTLAQPNYVIRHMVVPKSLIDLNEMWTQALDKESPIYTLPEARYRGEFLETKDELKTLGESSEFYKTVTRLGGKIKSLVLNLLNLAEPSEETVSVTRYEYVLGAWEIDFRLKDYIPSGYWVSKPLGLTGEVRQIKLIPDASPMEAGKINYYVIPRAEDAVEPSNLYRLGDIRTICFKGSHEPNATEAYYGNSLKEVYPSSYKELTIPVNPKAIKRQVFGTDRHNKLTLDAFPYIDTDAVMRVHNQIRTAVNISGKNPNKHNRYDPNALYPVYVRTDVAASGQLDSIEGYMPMKVTLRFSDGTVVPPDTIGTPPHNRYRLVEAETLTETTEGMIVKLSTMLQKNKTTSGDISQLFSSELKADIKSKMQLSDTELNALLKDAVDASTVSTQESKQKVVTFATKYPIAWVESAGGPRIALYWKVNGADIFELIDPSTYNIRWGNSITSPLVRVKRKTGVKSRTANTIEMSLVDAEKLFELGETGGPKYSLVAFYRTEASSQPQPKAAITPLGAFTDPITPAGTDEYSLFKAPAGGIPQLALQNYPVTRNMTDYLEKNTPELRKANLDPTSLEYYPVYEYYIDSSGAIVFANDLFHHGDTPALIEVEYESLDINPRIVIEYAEPLAGMSASRTPMLFGYTLLLNVRT